MEGKNSKPIVNVVKTWTYNEDLLYLFLPGYTHNRSLRASEKGNGANDQHEMNTK